MNAWQDRLAPDERAALIQTSHSTWLSPMLATLTRDPFSDPEWIYEPKLDGERLLLFRNAGQVRLLTRNRKQVNGSYPELLEAARRQDCADYVIDGEVVAFRNGISSFSRLQQRMKITDPDAARSSGVAIYFYAFDLPYLEGFGLEQLPLRRRKSLLKQILDFGDRLRFTPHRNRDGQAWFREACARGWEGLIAKRADSGYEHRRSRDWLKFKCTHGQELVIGGFTEPRGERIGFGALLVGYYDEKGLLRYAGKVGTGYDDDFLAEFRARLDAHTVDAPPFVDAPGGREITWVEPRFVGEFGFTEWTADRKLRHPRFLGLRRDKKPRDIGRESRGE